MPGFDLWLVSGLWLRYQLGLSLDSDYPALASGLHLDSGYGSDPGLSTDSDLSFHPSLSPDLDSSTTLGPGPTLCLVVTYAPTTRPDYWRQLLIIHTYATLTLSWGVMPHYASSPYSQSACALC